MIEIITRIAEVIAEEAERNPAFRAQLESALETHATLSPTATDEQLPADIPEPVPKDNDQSLTARTARAQPQSRRFTEVPMAGVKRRGGRRTPAILDPIELAAQGEAGLRNRLNGLDLELLLDIVAQYGMDPGKLVMKWRDPDRVIDRIVEISLARATKGDAFRKD